MCFQRVQSNGVVWSAAESDIVLTEAFVRTIELLDPITTWLKPATLKRIVSSRR